MNIYSTAAYEYLLQEQLGLVGFREGVCTHFLYHLLCRCQRISVCAKSMGGHPSSFLIWGPISLCHNTVSMSATHLAASIVTAEFIHSSGELRQKYWYTYSRKKINYGIPHGSSLGSLQLKKKLSTHHFIQMLQACSACE